MFKEIQPYLNFTQLFVAATYGYFLIHYKSKSTLQYMLLLILSLSFINELVMLYLLAFRNGEGLSVVYSLSGLMHNLLWFIVLYKVLQKRYIKLVITIYLLCGLLNLFFYEGLAVFNHFTFIAGALAYIAIFVHESFYLLKNEDLSYFLTNSYLLLISPIVFMLGFSMLLGFNNVTLYKTIVYNHMRLFDVIGYFINLIYYSLLTVYITREKKPANV